MNDWHVRPDGAAFERRFETVLDGAALDRWLHAMAAHADDGFAIALTITLAVRATLLDWTIRRFDEVNVAPHRQDRHRRWELNPHLSEITDAVLATGRRDWPSARPWRPPSPPAQSPGPSLRLSLRSLPQARLRPVPGGARPARRNPRNPP